MLSCTSMLGRRLAVRTTTQGVRAVSTNLTPAQGEAARLLDLAGCQPGDVVLQNGTSEIAQAVASQGYQRGLYVLSVMPAAVDFFDKSKEFKAGGGFALVADTYTRSFRLRRLLSELKSPAVVINHVADDANLWPLFELIKVASPDPKLGRDTGNTALIMASGKLPKTVDYPGKSRKVLKWADVLKSRKVEVKSL